MKSWAEDQGIDDNDKRISIKYVERADHMVTFLADTAGTLIKTMGLELTAAVSVRNIGPGRSKRFAALYEDGVLKALEVSEGPDGTDPAGDDDPSKSCVDHMLTHC